MSDPTRVNPRELKQQVARLALAGAADQLQRAAAHGALDGIELEFQFVSPLVAIVRCKTRTAGTIYYQIKLSEMP